MHGSKISCELRSKHNEDGQESSIMNTTILVETQTNESKDVNEQFQDLKDELQEFSAKLIKEKENNQNTKASPQKFESME